MNDINKAREKLAFENEVRELTQYLNSTDYIWQEYQEENNLGTTHRRTQDEVNVILSTREEKRRRIREIESLS